MARIPPAWVRPHWRFALWLIAAVISAGCASDGSDASAPPCSSCRGSGGGGDTAGPDGSGGNATSSSAGNSSGNGGGGNTTPSSGGSFSGAGGSSAAGTSANNGGSATTGAGGTPAPEFTLVVDTPKNGDTVSGSVVVSGWARGFKNVEAWDMGHQKPPLGQAPPGSDGAFTLTVDTRGLAMGPTTWTIWAWDSPPGTTSTRSDSVDLALTIGMATPGAGGASGTGGASGAGGAGTGGAPGTGGSSGNGSGRNYILGFYTSGKTSPPYHTFLGYYPEVNYGGSYQVHQPGGGFYLPGVKYPTVLDADISSNGAHMSYDSVASGQMDSQLNSTINSIPSAWYPYIYAVRIDSEFNLESDYKSPSASTYVKAADHLIALYKAKLPARVKYIWNPNAVNGGDLSALVPTTCDVIGVDAYANPTYNNKSSVLFGDKNNPGAGTIWWWTKIAKQKGKAIALPEWGDDYADGQYIKDVAAWAGDPANNVVYLGYWDSADNENASLRGASLTVFTDGFANKPYTGTFFAPLLSTATPPSGF